MSPQKLMENENQNQITETTPPTQQPKKNWILSASILASALVLAGALVYTDDQGIGGLSQGASASGAQDDTSALEEDVLPSDGVVLPVVWGDLGAKLVEAGAIDAEKFRSIYEQKGAFTDEYEYLLSGDKNGRIKITNWNS